jgi:hypothetical protein
MQTAHLADRCYSDDPVVHPCRKLKLPAEIILEQLYLSGSLIKDVLSSNPGDYYPKALTEEEIVEKTKLSAEMVSKRLKSLTSDEFDKPPIKKLKNGVTKYEITPMGINLLRLSPAIDIPVLYAEYHDEEQ